MPKPLVELQGRPLLAHALGNALQVCRRCILVTGCRHEEIERFLREEACSERVETVFHPDFRRGMFSSIRAGARHVSSEWFFVAPADMPFLSPPVYHKLLDAACDVSSTGGGPVTFFPRYRDRRGHPVLIHRSVVPAMNDDLRAASVPASMKSFLARWNTADVEVESEGILFDVDTPERLEEARRFFL